MDLQVYKLSFELLEQIYQLIKKIPRSEIDTINQIKRASKSIPANIAEGFAKKSSEKEFKRFLKIALGSSDEVITHLRMLLIVSPRIKDNVIDLGKKYKILSKRMNSLHSHWQSGGIF